MSAQVRKRKSVKPKRLAARVRPRVSPSARRGARVSVRARASQVKAPPALSAFEDMLKPATVAQKRAFLEVLFDGQNITVALRKAKLVWRQVSWALANGRHHDPDFLELYKEGLRVQQELRQIQREEKADSLALDGWKEPILYKGKEVKSIHRVSERMLELQLKRGAPHAYAERHEHEHTGAFNITTAIPEPKAAKE